MTESDIKDFNETLSIFRHAFDKLVKAGVRNIYSGDIHVSPSLFLQIVVPNTVVPDGENDKFIFRKGETDNGIVLTALFSKEEEKEEVKFDA